MGWAQARLRAQASLRAEKLASLTGRTEGEEGRQEEQEEQQEQEKEQQGESHLSKEPGSTEVAR